MWWRAFRVLMGIAVLGCIAASATFAFEFGWTRGATEVHRWTYALAGVALDLIKAGLPILGAMAWNESKPRSLACWLVFAVLTGLSLWCAYGTTATQLAEKFADQTVASTTQAAKQRKLDRLLEDKRKQLPYTVTSEEVVRLANEKSATATNQRIAECGEANEKRGPLCKGKETAETNAKDAATKAATDRAATVAADKLAADIEQAEAELAKVDVKTAAMEADPQSASMAKAIDGNQHRIAAISHAIFAIAIELGSGVGFWLVFGHGAPSTRRKDVEPSVASTALVPINRSEAVDLQVVEEKPEEIIERFFAEVVRPSLNRRVRSLAVWSAYAAVVCRPRIGARVACHVRAAGTLAEGPDRRDGLVSRLRARRGLCGAGACAGAQGAAPARDHGQRHADHASKRHPRHNQKGRVGRTCPPGEDEGRPPRKSGAPAPPKTGRHEDDHLIVGDGQVGTRSG